MEPWLFRSLPLDVVELSLHLIELPIHFIELVENVFNFESGHEPVSEIPENGAHAPNDEYDTDEYG